MIFIILLLCTATVFADPPTLLTEEDARNFIKESSEEFYDFYDTLGILTFDSNNEGSFIELLQKLNLLEILAKNLTEMSKKTENYPYETFKDEEIKLGIKNIRFSPYLYVLGEEYFGKLLQSTEFLNGLASDSVICNYNDSDKCDMAYLPNIYKIISKTDDEAELKYYWKETRNHNSKFGLEHFKRFIELFKKAANIIDTKPLDLWYRIYMDRNFFDEMEKVMKEIQIFYKKIHSYIRYDLNKIYGDKIISKNGQIPYHLYEKIIIQNWYKNVIEPPHPNYKLPNYDKRIEKLVDNSDKTLLQIADEFYESMGIEDIDKDDDDDYALEHIKNLDNKSTDSIDNCKAEIYSKSRYYYLKICPQISFKKYLQNHGWAIPIYFVQQKMDLSFANFQSYNFEIPTGEAIILSASSPKHLGASGLLTDQENDNDQLAMNRLFKMSIHTMLNLPIYFVHSKVMNDILSGEVELDDVNDYYWKLMKQYAGVSPPVKRTKESFDFSYKFFEDLENNHQTTKFVSEIAGYQIYRSLCKKSEIIQPALQNCDFHKSKNVGDNLKEFMKLGSTKNWRKTLSVITGDEKGLSGKAILEYYQPLTIWLNENIEGIDIPVGW